MSTPRPRNRWLRLLLALGFLALGIATVAAHRDPPSGYELSIYWSTTPVFWGGVVAAVVAALLVSFSDRSSRPLRVGGVVLAHAAVLSIIALPILRSFFFYGSADSLDHLGWARMMAGEIPNTSLNPLNLLYPGLHATGVFVSDVMGVPLTLALQYGVVVFTILFLVFIPLTVRAITDDDVALIVGSFSALLLLPINNISVFNLPYPTSQALYLLAPLLFLTVAFVTLDGDAPRSALVGWGVLLAVAGLAVLLVHPIVAIPAIVLTGMVAVLQWLYRWRWPEHPIAGHRPLYAHAALFVVAFLAWSQRFDRVAEQEEILLQGLFFGGQPIGDEITRRTGALELLGGGIEELFVKIFLVTTVFAALTGGVMLASFLGKIDDDATDEAAVLKYFSASVVPIVLVFVVFFLASLSVLPFRFLGAVMVLATVIGAVAIAEGLRNGPRWPSYPTISTIIVVLLFVGLAAQMAHVHQSPYIYRGSSQVTQMQYEGHETAFQHRDPAVWWLGIRSGPERYVNAQYGTTHTETTPSGIVFEGKETAVPAAVFGQNMTTHFGRDRYLGISRVDVLQETELYDGFRYSSNDFRRVETTPHIHRIQSNSDFWVYYVDSAD